MLLSQVNCSIRMASQVLLDLVLSCFGERSSLVLFLDATSLENKMQSEVFNFSSLSDFKVLEGGKILDLYIDQNQKIFGYIFSYTRNTLQV